ncbi:SHOCT domain-containing protein [Clostridium algoriphilum]|nr:SHOCT domain-containing protein [Clostridium algoriphilum]MCB2295824.1 SHOCT domain-containing protein [Clostridium algoriphilum]
MTELRTPNNIGQSESLSSLDEIKKLKELLDMGSITQEEYDAKKRKLLG